MFFSVFSSHSRVLTRQRLISGLFIALTRDEWVIETVLIDMSFNLNNKRIHVIFYNSIQLLSISLESCNEWPLWIKVSMTMFTYYRLKRYHWNKTTWAWRPAQLFGFQGILCTISVNAGFQGYILPPCPLGHGQSGLVFFVQKRNWWNLMPHSYFQKWSERPEKLIILSLPASTSKERLN